MPAIQNYTLIKTPPVFLFSWWVLSKIRTLSYFCCTDKLRAVHFILLLIKEKPVIKRNHLKQGKRCVSLFKASREMCLDFDYGN